MSENVESDRQAVGILDVDLGNSALKYRCVGSPRQLPRTLPHKANGNADVVAIDIESDLKASGVPLERVRASSVLNDSQNAAFIADVFERWGVEVEFARSERHAGGVTNGYEEPAALGVDRWMAVLAAYQRAQAATLVIDLGTAITLDYVDAQGRHQGGYIVPGTRLMQSSLLSETASIDVSGAASDLELMPGTSTKEAVSRGALAMVRHMIEAEVERFGLLCHHAPLVFLCGGGAEVIAPHLSCPHELVPTLVLDGLGVALP